MKANELRIGAHSNQLYIYINKKECGIAIENSDARDDESEELNFTIKINSVHQLQNLYFALSGEELEFKT